MNKRIIIALVCFIFLISFALSTALGRKNSIVEKISYDNIKNKCIKPIEYE